MALVPGDDVDEIGKGACRVRRGDADRMSAVHESPPVRSRLRIRMGACQVERQARQLGGGGHRLSRLEHPGGPRHRRVRTARRCARTEGSEIPAGDRLVEGHRTVERADRVEVVVVLRRARHIAERQHRAPPEVEHRALVLVDGPDAQHREPRRGLVGTPAVVAHRHHLGRRVQRVADPRRAQQPQATVEEVRDHPLRRERGLADGDVTDQAGMSRLPAAGQHPGGERRVERQAKAIADDRLMKGRVPMREGERGRVGKHLTYGEILIERTAQAHRGRRSIASVVLGAVLGLVTRPLPRLPRVPARVRPTAAAPRRSSRRRGRPPRRRSRVRPRRAPRGWRAPARPPRSWA